jgi:hypothetical protein
VNTADGTGLHRVADVRTAPGTAAVVAGSRPPSAQAQITAALSSDYRGAALPHDDQAVRGERLEGVTDDTVPIPCRALTSVIDGSSSPGPRIPDWMATVSVAVTCCQAGRESRGLITSNGTLRCSMNGLPVQDRSPQRLSSAYSLSRMGPRTSGPSRAQGQA